MITSTLEFIFGLPPAIRIYIILSSILLGRIVYLLIRKKSAEFKKSSFKVLAFGCISIIVAVICVTQYFPAHKSIPSPKELKVQQDISFNSDSLDKYFMDLPKHDSILVSGLKDIDRNRAFDYINYYNDKLSICTDPEYVDVANWALGIVHYYTMEYQAAFYFKKVQNTNLYKYNYYIALVSLSRNDLVSTEKFLSYEYKNRTKQDKALINLYFSLLLQNRNIATAREIYKKEVAVLDKSYKNVYYIYDLRYIDYFSIQFKTFLESTRLINLVIALFITFTWFYFLYFSDLFQKEKFRYLFFICIIEALLVFLCPFLYKYIEFNWGWSISSMQTVWSKLAYAVGCISLIEEIVKAIPFLILLLFFNEPDDSYDYLFYMCMSALMFSFIENCIYFNSAHSFAVYNGRALFSTIAHLYSSSMVGYGFMYAKFRKGLKYRWAYVLGFFFGGILFHGLYDFFLFTNTTLLFYLGYFMSIVVWVVLLNNSLNNSHYFSYKFENRNQAIQIVIGINLTLVMLAEYLLNALNNGHIPANTRMLNQIMIYGVVISFFISRLAKYDLVQGYWRKVTFNGYRADRYYFNRFNLLSYISNFFLFNRIHPRNYVGYKIHFVPPKDYYLKTSLFRHIQTEISGEIMDRWVIIRQLKQREKEIVVERKNRDIVLEDPQWFLIHLSQPVDWTFHSNRLIFKFINPFDELSETQPKMVILYSPKTEDVLFKPERNMDDFEFVGVAGILGRP